MKQALRRGLFVLVGILVAGSPLKGQDIGDVIGDVPEQNLKAYMLPFANSMGMGLNTGLFNSAKTHDAFGFDITLNVLGMFIPEDDQTFGWENFTFEAGVPVLAGWSVRSLDENVPTVFGSDVARLEYSDENGVPQDTVELFGTGVAFAPLITPQVAIGIPFLGDVTVRYIPKIKLRDNVGEVGMFGIGLMHSIDQYIPYSPVHLAVQGFWQKLDASYGSSIGANQEKINASGEITTWNFNAIVSKQMLLLTLYGAVGIETSEMTVKYSYAPVIEVNLPGGGTSTLPVAPISTTLDFKSDNTVRFTGGFTVNIVPLFFTAEVSKADYTALRAGLGISIR